MIYLIKPKSILTTLSIIAFLLIQVVNSHAQDVVLNNQSEVNSFFPGSVYNGNIIIGRVGSGLYSDITDLSNFSFLRELNGSLTFSINYELEHLDDLANLETINGNLRILQNGQLLNIDGLMGLETVDEFITISQNEVLDNINGLSNLTTSSGISVNNNNSMTNITGMSEVSSNLGYLEIFDNAILTEVNGFEKLTEIVSLFVGRNPSLLSLKGFSSLKRIEGPLDLINNGALSNFDALNSLIEVGDLRLILNSSIEHLDALSNLIAVTDNLQVSGNSSLTDCCGIQQLIADPFAVGGTVLINNNPSECSTPNEIIERYCGLDFRVGKNSPCIDASNGSFQISVLNYDTIPFYYQWERQEDGLMGSGSSTSDYFTIDMLEAGTYDIMLTTTKPDTAYAFDVTLTELDGSVFEIIQIESTNSSNGTSNGSIEIVISGSSPPYDISWTGPVNGAETGILTDTIVIPFIPSGEYLIRIWDQNGNEQEVTLTLLDDTVPTFPCTEPLDIVILNDVSGSVDSVEYLESKDFYLNFLDAANIGPGADESRAAIIEWSSEDEQILKIGMTGAINILNGYIIEDRSFFGGTNIHEAMIYGEEYIDNVARPDAERVIILATDGTTGQVPASLIALADQFKAKGYHILTIAFDDAYEIGSIRNVLIKMASIGALAPGAPAYSDLDKDLAENIVNTYLCPIDPGESSNVYFNRDGSIEINELDPIANCVNPKFVDVTFTVSAFRELSVPGGTFVTFYLNDPEQFGATPLLTWQIPCSIPVDSTETYTVTLPMNGPSHIFAVLNDDGSVSPPISFPITDIEELAYSNNIDDEWICIGDNPTIQALKHTTTPTPSCDSLVHYIINVCNISDADATAVEITDQPPNGFILEHSILNLNGCAIENNGLFDIPAGCCLSIGLTYDASGAAWGYYSDQGVLLDGPSDQEYYGYDGASSTAEDVILDGTIDCPSTIIEFTKEVNVMESCDDAFLTFTFTINNELNFPLQGLTFSDIVPLPSTWVFEPYNLSGLSIGNVSINQNTAQFVIDQVDAETVASFSMDLSLGFWENDGTLLNTAVLGNVPDLENGGTKIINSNTTSSEISITTPLSLPDTIHVKVDGDTLIFDIPLFSEGIANWTSTGDGTFIDFLDPTLRYVLGDQDKADEFVVFILDFETDCYHTTEEVVVVLNSCTLEATSFDVGTCDDNGTPGDPSDDTFDLGFTISSQNTGLNFEYIVRVDNDSILSAPFEFYTQIALPADGMDHIITFVDAQDEDCFLTDTVNVASCSDQCDLTLDQLLVTDCDDNDTPDDNSDDIFSVNFNIAAMYPGIDSSYLVIIGNDTLDGFTYFEDGQITIAASNNINAIQFLDSQNDYCSLTVNVGVENCIYPCELFIDQYIVSTCDDGGTPGDDSDDTFTITFDLSSSYPGIDSTYIVLVDNDNIGEYPYGTEQTISLQANGIDQIITFVDSHFADCIWSDTVNVQSCSDPCVLSLDQFIISECDDNGTPGNDMDDTFTVTFSIGASYPGQDSTFFLIIENDTLGEYAYGSEQLITLGAGDLEYDFTFIDSEFEDCLLSEMVSVASCSDECAMILEQFLVSICDDNGTTVDNSDDTYSITFEISAVNAGMDNSFFVLVGNDTIGEFSYNSEQEITLPADGTTNIIMVDSEFEDCMLTESVPLDNCSTDCLLTFSAFSISECDDMGTENDSSDDIFELTIEVSAQNASAASNFYFVVGGDTLGVFDYDAIQIITLSAHLFDYPIFIIDTENEECFLTETVRVESCSNTCSLSIQSFSLSDCDDNGTENLGEDDTYSITFSVDAVFPYEDSTYTVYLDEENVGTFVYNKSNTLMINANENVNRIHFIDTKFSFCKVSENINLTHCSNSKFIIQDVVIPNVFSPNGDGINDEWFVELFNNSQIINCDIYDRWGNLIYRNVSSQPPVWDGSFNGKMVNSGVYIYKINYTDNSGKTITKYGDVTVVY